MRAVRKHGQFSPNLDYKTKTKKLLSTCAVVSTCGELIHGGGLHHWADIPELHHSGSASGSSSTTIVGPGASITAGLALRVASGIPSDSRVCQGASKMNTHRHRMNNNPPRAPSPTPAPPLARRA